MKKDRTKDLFLEQLRKIPIVQVSCEKVGIARNTVYRWRKESAEFAKAMDEALAEGEAIINDMGESQLMTLMKEKNWNAISFWLRKRNPKFKDRLEVVTAQAQEEMTPEQEADVKRALSLAAYTQPQPQSLPEASKPEAEPKPEVTNDNTQNHEQESKPQ